MRPLILMSALLLGLHGCASYSNWQPVADTQNDKNAANLPKDTEECRSLASQAGSVGTESAKGVAVGFWALQPVRLLALLLGTQGVVPPSVLPLGELAGALIPVSMLMININEPTLIVCAVAATTSSIDPGPELRRGEGVT